MKSLARLKLSNVSCVAVGTFNIYIIQPHYLAQMGALDEGAKVHLETDIRQPGFRFQIEGRNIKWNVRPDKLIVQSTSWGDDCGGCIAKVLRCLQWTPIRGIGVNADFGCNAEAAEALLQGVLLDRNRPENYEMAQRTWHRGLKSESGLLTNIQLSLSETKVGLSLNVHTELANVGVQSELAERAMAACAAFRDSLEHAVDLAASILPVELHYDNVHA